jgi:hypothetical protein
MATDSSFMEFVADQIRSADHDAPTGLVEDVARGWQVGRLGQHGSRSRIYRRPGRLASTDQAPPPTSRRKSAPSSMQ